MRGVKNRRDIFGRAHLKDACQGQAGDRRGHVALGGDDHNGGEGDRHLSNEEMEAKRMVMGKMLTRPKLSILHMNQRWAKRKRASAAMDLFK